MNAEISETIQGTILGLGMQISEIPAQRKFVSAECHAHSNAHKPPKSAAPTIFMLYLKIQEGIAWAKAVIPDFDIAMTTSNKRERSMETAQPASKKARVTNRGT